jgi:hypothetical protein
MGALEKANMQGCTVRLGLMPEASHGFDALWFDRTFRSSPSVVHGAADLDLFLHGGATLAVLAVPAEPDPTMLLTCAHMFTHHEAQVVLVQGPKGDVRPVLDRVVKMGGDSALDCLAKVCLADDGILRSMRSQYPCLAQRMVKTGLVKRGLHNQVSAALWRIMSEVMQGSMATV